MRRSCCLSLRLDGRVSSGGDFCGGYGCSTSRLTNYSSTHRLALRLISVPILLYFWHLLRTVGQESDDFKGRPCWLAAARWLDLWRLLKMMFPVMVYLLLVVRSLAGSMCHAPTST